MANSQKTMKSKKQKHPKFTHLTLNDRVTIQAGLKEKRSIHSIAEEIGKSPSTVSREIENHKTYYEPKGNDCVHRSICKAEKVCGKPNCRNVCHFCPRCKDFCNAYSPIQCDKRLNAPLWLCNTCHKFGNCKLFKIRYEAVTAHKQYEDEKTTSRDGFNLTNQEFNQINDLITPLIQRGLSPYAIKSQLGNNLPISENTLRRLINKGELDVRNIDLRSCVKRRPRKSTNSRKMKDEIVSVNKLGHLYSDYLEYIQTNDCFVCQMDCVEGLRDDNKVLLTLHFPTLHFQLAFIMKYHTSKCVVQALDDLEYRLGKDLYSKLFSVILTDNGHEFMNIEGIERSVFGGKRTTLFFCEPNHSEQKAECESNHRLIRFILPKPTFFENLSQRDITEVMNNINNYPRKTLQGLTPYRLAKSVLPQEFFNKLGIKEIPFDELNLTPTLIKK